MAEDLSDEEKRIVAEKNARFERRREAWHLSAQGYSKSAISKALSIHINTVYADLKIYDKYRKEHIENYDKKEEVGILLGHYEMLFELSMQDYKSSKTPSEKSKFLARASNLLNTKQNLLLETGLIQDVVGDSSHLTDDGQDMEKMPLDDLHSFLNNKSQKIKDSQTNIIPIIQKGVGDAQQNEQRDAKTSS